MTIRPVRRLARQRVKVDATFLPRLILYQRQQVGEIETRSVIRTRKPRVVVPHPEFVSKFQGMLSLEQAHYVSPVVVILNERRRAPRPVDAFLAAVDTDIRHMEGNAGAFAAAALHSNLTVAEIV